MYLPRQGCPPGGAKEGVIVMVAAYNLYLGGYLPRLDPQRSVHNRQELKTKYKNIVSMNNSHPQTLVRISNKTQAYVLSVKELSMELGDATDSVLRAYLHHHARNNPNLSFLVCPILQYLRQDPL